MLTELVKENPKNPRTITDAKFKKLVKSIQEFPQMLDIRPLVVDETMTVLGGNMRLKACKAAGLKEIPVIQAKDLSEEQKKEFVIKDNASFGQWDWDVLLTDEWGFQQVQDWGIDFPDAKRPKPEAREDGYEIEEQNEIWISPGDLIEIGPHRLLCGSATDPTDMDRLMNGKLADLVHTDPPYNVDYVGKTKDALKIKNDKMSDDNFYKFMHDTYTQMERALRPGGAFYIWHSDKEILTFLGALLSVKGLKYAETMHWIKSHFVFGRQDYHHRSEPALYGWKEGAGHSWYGDRKQDDLYDDGDPKEVSKWSKAQLVDFVEKAMESRPNTNVVRIERPTKSLEHPTMKPILLCAYYIGNSSQENDIVLDMFLGSGSTMVAAHQLNRVCYGTELDPKYCQVIVDRMRKQAPELIIKQNGKAI